MDVMLIFLAMGRLALDAVIKIDQHGIKKDVTTKQKNYEMSEIFCDNCENIFRKQSKINDKVIEEYDNIYGCYCSECGFFIKPDKEIKIIKENKQKINILRDEMVKKIKEKIRRYRDGY